MTSLSFHETMDGWVSFTQRDFNQALAEGKRAKRRLSVALDVEIDDLSAFKRDPQHGARVEGKVLCDELGGELRIESGTWSMFVATPDARHKRMRYRLRCRDPLGHALTLSGFKVVEDDPNYDSWTDVTTLFTRIFRGHVTRKQERAEDVVATGIIFVRPLGFLRQLATYRARGGSLTRRALAPPTFSELFLREMREAYKGGEPGDTNPDFPLDGPGPDARPPGEWHEVRSRPGLWRRIVPYETDDHLHLDLHHLSRGGTPKKGPVILCHGAGGRAQVWYGAPMRKTICDALLEAGYDVWVQNWRGSIDYAPHQYSLDVVAARDHPAALKKIREETGAERMKAIVQCQGSTSMTIAAIAGKVPELTHVLASAVSLHPVVPRKAHLKTAVLLPGLRRTTPYLDAQWAIRAPTLQAAMIAGGAKLVRHRDCDEPVCHVATYMFGWGGDLLWLHANLEADVHRFLSREFGYVPIRFFRQIHRSISAGHLVPFEQVDGLPESYVDQAPQTDARFTFATGAENRLFLPIGQRRSFKHFERFARGRHAHVEWPRHSHLDPWLSRTAERDVFPSVLDALER